MSASEREHATVGEVKKAIRKAIIKHSDESGGAPAGDVIDAATSSVRQDSKTVCNVLESQEQRGEIYTVNGDVKLTDGGDRQ